MTALLFRIFLSLSVLLLSGYGSLSAPSSGRVHCYPKQDLEYSAFLPAQVKPSLIVNPAESHQGIPFFKMVATEPRGEEDEHEHDSLRKRSGNGSYVIVLFSAEALRYFLSEGKKRQFLHAYYSHTASYRYLVFQVFRI